MSRWTQFLCGIGMHLWTPWKHKGSTKVFEDNRSERPLYIQETFIRGCHHCHKPQFKNIDT